MTEHDDSAEDDSGRSMYDESSGLLDESSEGSGESNGGPDEETASPAASEDDGGMAEETGSTGSVENAGSGNSANSERSEDGESSEGAISSEESESPGEADRAGESPDAVAADTPGGEDQPSPAGGEGVGPENRLLGQGGDEQLVSAGSGEPEQSTGTFYVKHVEETATTLHEIHTSQVYVVIENPDLEPGEILEASLIAQPPMELSYRFNEITSRRTIPVEISDLEPTRKVRDIAGRMDVGEAVAIEREGEGEIHILTVEPDQAGERAEEVSEDETTYKNAGRYEVDRVEIRTDEAEGIVSIRYLPD